MVKVLTIAIIMRVMIEKASSSCIYITVNAEFPHTSDGSRCALL